MRDRNLRLRARLALEGAGSHRAAICARAIPLRKRASREQCQNLHAFHEFTRASVKNSATRARIVISFPLCACVRRPGRCILQKGPRHAGFSLPPALPMFLWWRLANPAKNKSESQHRKCTYPCPTAAAQRSGSTSQRLDGEIDENTRLTAPVHAMLLGLTRWFNPSSTHRRRGG